MFEIQTDIPDRPLNNANNRIRVKKIQNQKGPIQKGPIYKMLILHVHVIDGSDDVIL